MKENLLNNLGIKILSLCLAAMFWLAIVNIDDPIKSRTFYNVPVEVKNEETLASRNMAYDVVSGRNVDFTVTGKRSVIDELRKTDFTVTADLATLTQQFDSIKINVECQNYPDLEIVMGKISTMTVSVEDIIEKQFAVKVVPSGQAAPGFAAGSPVASPLFVNVSGAESIVSQIAEVRVLLDINNKSQDITDSLTPKAYNEKGLEIDRDKLKFSYNKITVKVPMLETKIIPVVLTTKGEPKYGYQYVKADFEPKEIEVKGDRRTLDRLTSIPIELDISGLDGEKEDIINILDYLEKYDVSPVKDDISDVVVKIRIEKLVEKRFAVNSESLNVRNLNDGYEYFNLDGKEEYYITVMGLRDVVDDLELETLSPFIDLGGLKVGRNEIAIQVTLPSNITLVSADKVTLQIKKAQKGETPTTSPAPTTPVEDDVDNQIPPEPETPTIPEEPSDEEQNPGGETEDDEYHNGGNA